MPKEKLQIKAFHINTVTLGKKVKIDNNVLTIPTEIVYNKDIFETVSIKIIKPKEHDIYVNTIMDIVPISTKVIGRLGEGITHTLTGVYTLLTGANTKGEQMHEFGSSEGILSKQLVLNKAGSPSVDDYLIHIDVVIKDNIDFDRALAFSIFELSDLYLQEIREAMKVLSGRDADEVHEFYNTSNPGKPKVALVKEVAGQGMMYDNQLFPIEPSGIDKGISIIDMNNMPVLLTANEYRDGAIRAMV
ncbi:MULTISPECIES: proline reductase cluster protein PrdD [Gemella]|uniref:proline reductase cluster protein PrdD n=1 Tax=Gemella TaxID=1378 RepID=UPI00093020F8|nr:MULTISPECIES: proline reductase cluster protein PrdD [Gemella]AXI26246.1 proline reductase cluster protein PrdD [Gemella sp. ND 6198]